MNNMLADMWQFNIELSLILMFVLMARIAVRKTTRVYNAYILWLSIPIGLLLAQIISRVDYVAPQIKPVEYLVQSPIMLPPQGLSRWDGVLALWAVVALALLIRLFVQHIRLRQELALIVTEISLDVQSNYPVVAIDKEDFSPAVYGFFRPTIFFPVQLLETLSATQVRLIIEHEEQHIRQQHLWLNLAWDIAVCLVWFNPLIYLARQNFRHDQELFCDYLVLNKSNQNASRAYGHALLTTVTATHSVSLLCSWKTFNQIEERIMNIKRPTSIYHKIALGFASALIVLSMSMYSVSASQHANDQYSMHEDDGQREVVWHSENKTYIDRNGEQSVIENQKEREMSVQEQRDFAAKMKQSNLEIRAAEKDLQRTTASMHKLEALENSFKSREEAMLESERIRLESDAKRRAIDIERMRMDAERVALEAQVKQRDEHRASVLGKHVERHHAEQIGEVENHQWRQHKEQAIEEFELSKVERLIDLAEHEAEFEAQHAQRWNNYEHEIESALDSIEGLKIDIELSLKNSNVPIEEQYRIREQLENAKRDIERSKQLRETKLGLNVVTGFANLASLSKLSELSELSERSELAVFPEVAPIQQIAPIAPTAPPVNKIQKQEMNAFDYRRSQ